MFPFSESIETTTLAAAVLWVRKPKAEQWRLFIPFLLLTLAVEIAGRIIARQHLSNHWLYNIYLPIEVVFTGWFFYVLFPSSNKRLLFSVACFIFLIAVLIESLWRRFMVYNSYSDSLASFLFIYLSCSYYFLLVRSDSYIELKNYAPFWFVTGVFLFNFGSMATVLFTDDIMNINVIGIISLRYLIYLLLTLIIYACWSYAFLCKYQEKISSQA